MERTSGGERFRNHFIRPQAMLLSERFLTFHANKQQVRGQLPPATLSLLLINPVPVKTQEVHDNLPAHSVIECLLQIQPMFPKKKIPLVHVHTVPGMASHTWKSKPKPIPTSPTKNSCSHGTLTELNPYLSFSELCSTPNFTF